MTGFAATIEGWCNAQIEHAETVFRESIVEIISVMQIIGPSTAYPVGQGGYTPIDTGWHQNSLQVSFTMMPTIDPGSFPPDYLEPGMGLHMLKWDTDATYAKVRMAEFGKPVYVGYTAAYSLYLEFRSAVSSAFVRKAVQRWPAIVEEVSKRYS